MQTSAGITGELIDFSGRSGPPLFAATAGKHAIVQSPRYANHHDNLLGIETIIIDDIRRPFAFRNTEVLWFRDASSERRPWLPSLYRPYGMSRPIPMSTAFGSV